jgi:lipopolysaccharide assembly protein A
VPQPAGGQPAVPQPAVGQPAAAAVRQHKIRRTRMGGAWTGLALAAIVLIFLLVFILENGKQVSISYFGAHGHLPLGVALLFAAVAGALLVMIPGTGRILQLRRTARRHRKLDAARQAPTPGVAPAPPESRPAGM